MMEVILGTQFHYLQHKIKCSFGVDILAFFIQMLCIVVHLRCVCFELLVLEMFEADFLIPLGVVPVFSVSYCQNILKLFICYAPPLFLIFKLALCV